MSAPATLRVVDELMPLLRDLVPLNRTIVSDDMARAADLIDAAYGHRGIRHRYASGTEHGSWPVPPSWNVREAFLSDGESEIASYRDDPLFLAPYSAPFDGWVSRDALLERTFVLEHAGEAFSYQHRVAYDHRRRLRDWQISLPARVVAGLDRDRYRVRIDADVRPGHLEVIEHTVPGASPAAVVLLAHLCHPGQANDGLSGVIAGLAVLRLLREREHRLTYRLLLLPETIGSAVHVVASGLGPGDVLAGIFMETMGAGERLCLKLSRRGDRAIDLAASTIARERPELRVLAFYEGYGNDEHVFDFPNVGIPTLGVQHYPFAAYHTSRDDADGIDPERLAEAVDLVLEVLARLEADRIVALRYPGPPYLSRYELYADSVTERARFSQMHRVLALCDGTHSLLEMCEASGLPFTDVRRFVDRLDEAGMLRDVRSTSAR